MTCNCVQKHVPLPMVLLEINVGGELISVCPTTYENIQDLLRKSQDGIIADGYIRKHYSRFVREIVATILVDQL